MGRNCPYLSARSMNCHMNISSLRALPQCINGFPRELSTLKIEYNNKYSTYPRLQLRVGFSLREPQHTPLEHTPDIPKPPNERNSFINCWLGVWGMLQGSVGKFLDSLLVNFKNIACNFSHGSSFHQHLRGIGGSDRDPGFR